MWFQWQKVHCAFHVLKCIPVISHSLYQPFTIWICQISESDNQIMELVLIPCTQRGSWRIFIVSVVSSQTEKNWNFLQHHSVIFFPHSNILCHLMNLLHNRSLRWTDTEEQVYFVSFSSFSFFYFIKKMPFVSDHSWAQSFFFRRKSLLLV